MCIDNLGYFVNAEKLKQKKLSYCHLIQIDMVSSLFVGIKVLKSLSEGHLSCSLYFLLLQ